MRSTASKCQRGSHNTEVQTQFDKGGGFVSLTSSRQLLTACIEETLKTAGLSDNRSLSLLQKRFTDFPGAPNHHYTEL